MDYFELPPPNELRRHLECVWVLRDDAPIAGTQTVFPDGRCEIIAHLAQPMQLRRIDGSTALQTPQLFAAQLRGPVRLQATGPVHCVGARLRPAASALLAGPRLAALRDGIHDLHALAPDAAPGFARAASAFAWRAERRPLWDWLRDECRRFPLDAGIEAVIGALDASDGALRISALPTLAHCGMRSFQARFLAQVGLTAKEYARIRRLQASLRALDGETASVAQVAADLGYSDQAHATREFTRLTGHTPARLSRALHADRDADASLRLAAAFVRGRSAPK